MISSTLRRTAVLVALATATSGLVGATATAAEKTQTSLSIRAVKAAVKPGGTGRINGALVVASGSPAGKAVTLEAKGVSEDEFTPIGVALSGEQGGITLEVQPAETTRYRWDFDGDESFKPSVSGVVTVRVREPRHPALRLPASLSIRAKQPRVGLNGTTLVTGRLRSRSHALVGKRVLLLSKERGATKWSFEGVEQTAGRGQVAFYVSPLVRTRYRLAFLGSARFRAARSGVVHVAARPHALTITADPALVDPGAPATVSGVLTKLGAPFAGQSVQLRSKIAGSDGPFTVAATGTTGADGKVSFTVNPTQTTRYLLFLPHSEGVAAARSAVATVAVRFATSVSIRGRAIEDGYVVTGTLRGHGKALPGRPVTLQSLAPGATAWVDVATKLTQWRGKVRFVQPAAVGTSYRLTFAGGDRFTGSVSGVVVQ